MKENILIFGSRISSEAAAWSLRKSPYVDSVRVERAGSEMHMLQAVSDHKPSLTVIDDEAPLVQGFSDLLRARNSEVYGADSESARLAGSRIWAVRFMDKYRIPYPWTTYFNSYSVALDYVQNVPSVIQRHFVIKTDGLVDGHSGIVHCTSRQDALVMLKRWMRHGEAGESGKRVVVQKYADGPVVSVTAVVSGRHAVLLPPALRYMASEDGENGVRTDGMGAVVPHPSVSPEMFTEIERKIIRRAVNGLRSEGYEFRGTLSPLIALTRTGPKVLEWRLRFGDPDMCAVAPVLDGDLFTVIGNAAGGVMPNDGVFPADRTGVAVALAVDRTPEEGVPNIRINGYTGFPQGERVVLFSYQTSDHPVVPVQGGDRPVVVTGIAQDIRQARNNACDAIGPSGVSFDGMRHRTDIGL